MFWARYTFVCERALRHARIAASGCVQCKWFGSIESDDAFGVLRSWRTELARECGLRHTCMRSRAELHLFKSMAGATSRLRRWRDTTTTRSDFTSQSTPILLQYINVFHSSPKSLGRLGEPALLSHHLQGATVHRRLHPAVRSSGPHWPVWHEYAARIVLISAYIITNTTVDNSLKNLPLFAVPASLTFGYALL